MSAKALPWRPPIGTPVATPLLPDVQQIRITRLQIVLAYLGGSKANRHPFKMVRAIETYPDRVHVLWTHAHDIGLYLMHVFLSSNRYPLQHSMLQDRGFTPQDYNQQD